MRRREFIALLGLTVAWPLADHPRSTARDAWRVAVLSPSETPWKRPLGERLRELAMPRGQISILSPTVRLDASSGSARLPKNWCAKAALT